MEMVFSLEGMGARTESVASVGQFLNKDSKPGFVEKIVGSGRYVVTLADGNQVVAQGSRGLKPGNRVQVLSRIETLTKKKEISEIQKSLDKDPGLQVEAFFPLGFGGKKAKAFLKIYIEEKNEELLEKRSPAVYFIFNVETEKQGKLQWSVYLRERQIAIQVFSDLGDAMADVLKALVTNVEKNLRSRGYWLSSPTVYLKSFFRVPEGFRLNIKG